MKRSLDKMRVELAARILNGLFPAMVSHISEPLPQFEGRAEIYAERAVMVADCLLRSLEKVVPLPTEIRND